MNQRYQKGVTSVEFALIGVVTIMTIIGALEVARVFFVYNTLDEVTRRATRLAAVCPIGDPEIANKAVFNTSGGTNSPLVAGLKAANVEITYRDANGAVVTDTVNNFSDIEYVRASIVNYQHQFILPMFEFVFTAPPFQTTIPRESLGNTPEGIQSC